MTQRQNDGDIRIWSSGSSAKSSASRSRDGSVSLRLEMLQVARLAPQQLGESRDLVAAFLKSQIHPDGGFQNRSGDCDLYYTVFGIEGLIALQEPVPAETVAAFLSQFKDGDGLDFVHLACLARCWADISRDLSTIPVERLLAHIEEHRSDDGGYAQTRSAAQGNVYASFLALSAYQDLRSPLPQPEKLLDALSHMRAADGGYANQPGEAHGLTTVTAAAVMLLRTLEGPIEPHLRLWLLDRCLPSGGFLAAQGAPIPDLLSTATGLHALAALDAPRSGLREACLDFVDSLWTNRGGFYGTWLDDTLDCEYTYYGLLALGHLTV
jgi:prenyltransferase beta subunit